MYYIRTLPPFPFLYQTNLIQFSTHSIVEKTMWKLQKSLPFSQSDKGEVQPKADGGVLQLFCFGGCMDGALRSFTQFSR